MVSIYLIGIAPPGNIAKSVCRLQEKLFRNLGVISGFAFQVIIPIVFRSTCPVKSVLEEERKTFESHVQTDVLISSEDAFFLSTNNTETWKRIGRRLGENGISKPFNPAPGLFLCYREKRDITNKTIQSVLPNPPVLRWRTSRLICLKMETANIGLWWEQVYCETVFEEKTRAYPKLESDEPAPP